MPTSNSARLAKLFLFLLFCLRMSAFADQWEGVKPEELGITQAEFTKVKESGMSKDFLLKLLEVGISPNEYFSQPWKKLGVSEDHWLKEKGLGMADDDIDRSYRKQNASNFDPAIAFVLPGYYHYKTGRYWQGAVLSGLTVAGLVLTFTVKDNTHSIIPIFPLTALGCAIWSAGDAFLGTRYFDNEDATRFSLNLLLPRNGGAGAAMALDF